MAKSNSALQEQMKKMAKTNIALPRRMTQYETDLEKKSKENAKFVKNQKASIFCLQETFSMKDFFY